MAQHSDAEERRRKHEAWLSQFRHRERVDKTGFDQPVNRVYSPEWRGANPAHSLAPIPAGGWVSDADLPAALRAGMIFWHRDSTRIGESTAGL